MVVIHKELWVGLVVCVVFFVRGCLFHKLVIFHGRNYRCTLLVVLNCQRLSQEK